MTMHRPAFIFCVFSLLTASFAVSPAFAGFEWIPPVEIMEQDTMQAQPSQTPDFPLPVSPDMPPAGGGANMAVMPMDLTTPVEKPPGNVVPVRQKPQGLYINPFPDRNAHGASPGDAMIGIGPVEQAMMEVTQDLNPAPLGHGFTTAPKPQTRTLAVPRYQPATPGAAAPDISAKPLPPSGMTSLPGESAMMATSAMNRPTYPDRSPAPSSYAQPVGQYPVVQGFGRDMPLALALTQVIPPNYALSFGNGVNPGMSVSWEGGRPWNQVLQDMLGQAGLSVNISGQVVMVSSA